MEILETTEMLRTVNALLTPASLLLGLAMLGYSLRGWHNARNIKSKNEAAGIALVGVSSIFIAKSITLTLIYFIIFTTNDRELINFIVNIGFLVTNILIIVTSLLILGIYRDKI